MKAADFFGGREVIDKTYPAGHPMRELLVEDSLTSQSFQNVYDGGEIKWLETAKRCIDGIGMPTSMKCNDLSGYSSVLGEMRAFADLLQMSEFEVSSFGTGAKGPDFLLTKKNDGSRVYVEVFTRPSISDSDYEIEIDKGRREHFYDEKGVKCSIETTISVQAPFGFPKRGKYGESTTANAVSKICAIKHSEYQLDDNAESILYFDTQSLAMSFTMLEQCPSVLEFNGAFTSGAIWLAYYGEKGFPILENAGAGYVLPTTCVKMQHDGHFVMKGGSKLNAVIIGVANDPHKKDFKRLALLENPNRPLSDSIRTGLIDSGCFNKELSRYGAQVELKNKLQDDREKLFKAFEKFKLFHPLF